MTKECILPKKVM